MWKQKSQKACRRNQTERILVFPFCADVAFIAFPYVSLARQVFISHFWGRKGFVCSGTSTAVEELEKLVGSQPFATQENTGMVCCEHLLWEGSRLCAMHHGLTDLRQGNQRKSEITKHIYK